LVGGGSFHFVQKRIDGSFLCALSENGDVSVGEPHHSLKKRSHWSAAFRAAFSARFLKMGICLTANRTTALIKAVIGQPPAAQVEPFPLSSTSVILGSAYSAL